MYGSKDISFDRSDSISNVDTTWHSIPDWLEYGKTSSP